MAERLVSKQQNQFILVKSSYCLNHIYIERISFLVAKIRSIKIHFIDSIYS